MGNLMESAIESIPEFLAKLEMWEMQDFFS